MESQGDRFSSEAKLDGCPSGIPLGTGFAGFQSIIQVVGLWQVYEDGLLGMLWVVFLQVAGS